MKTKPYTKVITPNTYGVCAIYEPHPFGGLGLADREWCWVYYDICGNPVALSNEFPEGEVVDKFTEENIGSQSLADYFNKENEEYVKAWNEENML